MASMGLPAVIVPSRAILTVSSFFSKYSLGTNNSKALFFDSFFFIYPFSSNLFNTFFKNIPVADSLFFTTSSGVPSQIIFPPLFPPSGPKSII